MVSELSFLYFEKEVKLFDVVFGVDLEQNYLPL